MEAGDDPEWLNRLAIRALALLLFAAGVVSVILA
jgi:hypothetical protein